MGNESVDVVRMFAAAGDRATFPEVEITTARMRLRAYAEADIDEHLAIFDHDIARRWSSAPQPYTRRHARTWCTRTANEIRTSGDGICWAAEDLATGRLVGTTGLHRTDWDNRITDVSATEAGWAIGQGYAKEALRAIAHWVLVDQRFHRVQITAAVDNTAPRRVATACGFVEEGILRAAGAHHGTRVDMAVYGLVPGDLAQRKPPRYTATGRRHRTPQKEGTA